MPANSLLGNIFRQLSNETRTNNITYILYPVT
jgi:hypothetical protein